MPALQQKTLIRGFTDQVEHTVLIHGRLAVCIIFDDHHIQVSFGEIARQYAADPAIPADDVMVLQLGDLFVQFTPPENYSYAVFHQKLYKQTDYIHKITNTRHDEDDREGPAGITDLMNLAVTDGGQGNNRHVQGIIKWPSLDEHVSNRTDKDETDRQNDAEGEVAFTFHGVYVSIGQGDRSLAIRSKDFGRV
jgi:hypothetical protein